MKIKQLAKQETAELKMLCTSFQQEVEAVISKMRGKKVRLYLPEREQYRLLKLKVWTERYQVDLSYIIQNLLPFWETWVQRKSKAIKSEGLGVRIATLTGKKSEQMLQLLIKQDFNESNKILYRLHKQEVILNKAFDKSEDGIKIASDSDKTLFDFPHPRGYLQYYRRRIRRQQDKRDRIIQEMKKRPYRGNPFVES